jgi:hypothetical protein
MISISTPLDSAQEVYSACARRTQNPTLRTALEAEGARVVLRSLEYLQKAQAAELYSLTPEGAQNVSDDDLADVYERVLVQGGERSTYDRLKAGARFGLCPLCAQRDVMTLDHYLPRASFPEFCVTPPNLLPCCSDCNKAKLHHVPDRYETQSFHPYFDDWSGVVLLNATPVITDIVDIAFSIDRLGDNSPPWVERAEWHFQLLDLRGLYRKHAAVELVQCKSEFRDHYSVSGSIGLRKELSKRADSRSEPFPNAWQPALYRGLAASDEFCEGGFEKIEEARKG